LICALTDHFAFGFATARSQVFGEGQSELFIKHRVKDRVPYRGAGIENLISILIAAENKNNLWLNENKYLPPKSHIDN
jgi:hypothetical protein